MKCEMGDVIITKVDRIDRFGDYDHIFIPKKSIGCVCEDSNKGYVLVEFAETKTHPACVMEYKEDEVSLKEKNTLKF